MFSSGAHSKLKTSAFSRLRKIKNTVDQNKKIEQFKGVNEKKEISLEVTFRLNFRRLRALMQPVLKNKKRN